jgi:type VI secretion system protein ImpL
LLDALRDQVLPECKRIITGRYPFTRGSDQDVPLVDFGRVFGGGGLLDGFFKQHLQQYADTSRPTWTWKQDNAVTRSLSPQTLHEFQRAAQIRDAYFQGGGNTPMVQLAIKPPGIGGGNSAKFEIGGTVVASVNTEPDPVQPPSPFGGRPQPPRPREHAPSPVNVQWPAPSPRVAITVLNERYGQQPSVLERSGAWSLFRMLEAGSVKASGEKASASYIVGGQELTYQITTGSLRNPLNFQPLREFRCPGGI